ncbi:MAG TPA: IclR family transcriptional regulator [Jatrophihabitans sp.]|uniref:IclR family transcriptional regulator n=1 Tax=Jatrophihabitans sp. TaxID=1932789 RepID=UPI002E026931|nr:IclR family transcriptional regulator [Jatrophihabitans sp.]
MSNLDRAAEPAGVQSVLRALDVLETLADRPGGSTVADISSSTRLPMATTHRLLRTLVDRGYALQLADRRYALGLRLVTLGSAANVLLGSGVEAVLRDLVDELGETANVALFTGYQAEYVAQVPSRHSMRMFTELGRRVDLHCTGVGKAMLARLSADDVAAVVRRRGLPRLTEHTIGTPEELRAELARITSRGFAVDDEEQELGVRCVAVAIEVANLPWLAVSVSGPTARMTDAVIERAAALLQGAATRLAAELDGTR